MLKRLTIRQKGLNVIAESADLGLIVHWNQGSRIYLKVDPKWKNKVKGLCGNYNDNEADDFQTPSGGLTEVSANIFGDSWRLQAYCPQAEEISVCQHPFTKTLYEFFLFFRIRVSNDLNVKYGL